MKVQEQRVVEVAEAAAKLPDTDREAFVKAAAAGDRLLQGEVTSLLRAHDEAGQFLETPALGAFAELWRSETPEGQRIGPWQLQEKLGAGGMGTVYLAVRADDEYQRKVALKLLDPSLDSEEMVRRFRDERQILARLDHANIARLYDGGSTADGRPYLVMEYIEGTAIDEHCDQQRLSIRQRLELFRTVCGAVHFAHQNLVVHRDLKPSNILVTADGVPKLLDFGIAKLLEAGPAAGLDLTQAGLLPMTPNYASPEQIASGPITTASDVYSLGVLLYKLLTGRLPRHFESSDPREIERVLRQGAPTEPSVAVATLGAASESDEPNAVAEAADRLGRRSIAQWRRRLIGDLDRIVMKALRPEPERRYTSVQQLSEDLRRHLEGRPVRARRDTLGYRTGKFLRRNRIAAGVAATLFLLISSFSLFALYQAQQIARERDRAQLEEQKAVGVASFLVELLKDSDPAEARGREVTVREALDKGAARIRDQLQEQPEIRAMLLDTMGSIYISLGLYEEAEPLLETALDVRRQSPQTEPSSLATTLTHLGNLQKERGQYQVAEVTHQEALALRRTAQPGDDLKIAESLQQLGALAYTSGDFDLAEQRYREVLEIRQRSFGTDHPEIAEAHSDLGLVLLNKGDLEAAEPLLRQALSQTSRALGNDHPKALEITDNLATLRVEKGDLAGAEQLFQESLGRLRKIFDPGHPMIARALNNLATVKSERGDHAAAVPLLREVLANARQAFGEEHLYFALANYNLGNSLASMKEDQEAEPLMRRAVGIARQAVSPEHPHIAYMFVGLGALLMRSGELEEAEGLFREALERRAQGLPPEHPLTAVAASHLGACLGKMGRLEEAETLLSEAHAQLVNQRGDDNLDTQAALKRLLDFRATAKPAARTVQ